MNKKNKLKVLSNRNFQLRRKICLNKVDRFIVKSGYQLVSNVKNLLSCYQPKFQFLVYLLFLVAVEVVLDIILLIQVVLLEHFDIV